jgi:hypothetical protein
MCAAVGLLAAAAALGGGCASGDAEPSTPERMEDAVDAAGEPLRHPPDAIDPPDGSPTKIKMQEAINDIQNDFANGVGWVCNELSEAGQRELAHLVRPPHCTTTASWLSRLLRRMDAPLWYSRVVSVELDGNGAVAELDTVGKGRHRARFAADDGDWRLDSLRYAVPVGPVLDG